MTEIILLIVLIVISIVNLVLTLFKKQKNDVENKIENLEKMFVKFETSMDYNEKLIKDEFQRNRSETSETAKINRDELSKSLEAFSVQFSKNVKELNELLQAKLEELHKKQSELNQQNSEANRVNREDLNNSLKNFEVKFTENIKELNEILRQKFSDFAQQQVEINKQTIDNVKEVRETVEKNLSFIREDNNKQLDEMRKTVDEKLQKTLNERLSQSFETVSKQLQSVQEGLGEMKNLATDVGGLKNALSSVKLRGGIGEVQLSMLLEQILAPDQYETNVRTKAGSSDSVEFAVKLPGKDDSKTVLWLPIDAKFPKDVYEKLQNAYDDGSSDKIAESQKELENTIKKMAKDISDKYLDPPNTTDFGIMFLPFEGIYAEVVRKAALLEELQKKYKILVTGPTTLAALLNSLQMGFRTLAIQKRSSEVWQVLGAVKKEFENFGGLMEKAQKNIQTGLNQLDDVMGTRTKAIQRKLKGVESLSDGEARKLIPEITDSNLEED